MDSIPQTSITNLTHYVWYDDENESLCGLDVTHEPWTTKGPFCHKCLEVDKFLTVFESFNTTYDTRESLQATVQAMKSELTV